MKRKWEDPQGENSKYSSADIELHLETPLPLEWQRCLDIQSGQIHFYNTKTQKRTSMDPRRRLEDPLSLDLELNLNCQSKKMKSDDGVILSGLERALKQDQEMVARVCMQCHLLVMLLKSSPTCPNCKFRHPIIDPQITPPTKTLFIPNSHRNTNNNQTHSFKTSFPNPIQNQV